MENIQRQDLFDLHSFDAVLARSPGRHGIKPLTHALGRLRDDPPWTQSELEDAFLDSDTNGGPARRPLLNQFVDGMLVDAFWPEHRLVVEVDGRTRHKTKRAVENDQQRDVKLQIAGYRVAASPTTASCTTPTRSPATSRAPDWRRTGICQSNFKLVCELGLVPRKAESR